MICLYARLRETIESEMERPRIDDLYVGERYMRCYGGLFMCRMIRFLCKLDTSCQATMEFLGKRHKVLRPNVV